MKRTPWTLRIDIAIDGPIARCERRKAGTTKKDPRDLSYTEASETAELDVSHVPPAAQPDKHPIVTGLTSLRAAGKHHSPTAACSRSNFSKIALASQWM